MEKSYELGMIEGGEGLFELLDEQLSTGVVILGQPGGGKSRLVWQLLREHRRNRRPFMLVDSGDLESDILADFADEFSQSKDESLLRRMNYLELSPRLLPRCAAFDPPDWTSDHPEIRHVLRRAWQETMVQARAQALLRSKGETDFGVQVRLSRVLTNVLMAVSTMVKSRRLPLGKIKALADVWHPEHSATYSQVEQSLPAEVAADFDMLHSMKRPQDIRLETESCLNLIRRSLGFLLTQALSGTDEEPSFSMHRAVEHGENVIVSTKPNLYCSHEQRVFFAALLIQDWFHAKLNCPRDRRRGSTLVIDECHEYLRVLPDLPYFQRVLRKYLGAIVLATQDVSSLR